jgi:short-subunit dehydrogenase
VWTDDVVVVTGASRGIGLEICRELAAAGARVAMIARDAAALDHVRAELGDRTVAAPADVTDPAQLTAALESLNDTLGAPTVLVNNAGQGAWGPVVATHVSEFRRLLEVNFLGAVHATGLVLPGMIREGQGHIVNIASIAGRIGAPFEAAYSASKFALVGYSEALAIELAGTGVTISLIDPGPVATEFFAHRGHPLNITRPKPVPPKRVARLVLSAIERQRHEIFVPRWLGGAHLVKTAVPGLYRAVTAKMYASERAALDNGADIEHR